MKAMVKKPWLAETNAIAIETELVIISAASISLTLRDFFIKRGLVIILLLLAGMFKQRSTGVWVLSFI